MAQCATSFGRILMVGFLPFYLDSDQTLTPEPSFLLHPVHLFQTSKDGAYPREVPDISSAPTSRNDSSMITP